MRVGRWDVGCHAHNGLVNAEILGVQAAKVTADLTLQAAQLLVDTLAQGFEDAESVVPEVDPRVLELEAENSAMRELKSAVRYSRVAVREEPRSYVRVPPAKEKTESAILAASVLLLLFVCSTNLRELLLARGEFCSRSSSIRARVPKSDGKSLRNRIESNLQSPLGAI